MKTPASSRRRLQLTLLAGGQLLCCQAARATVILFPQVPPLSDIWIFEQFDPVPMDINGDGATDLGLYRGAFGIGMRTYGSIATFGRVTNTTVPPTRESLVTAFESGEEIGPSTMAGSPDGESWILDSDHPGNTSRTLAFGDKLSGVFGGPFLLTRKFMGIRIELAPGEWHYGWVDIENNMAAPWNYQIHGWAWETEPNKPILAGAVPEPGSLALAATGAGLLAWRRRSSAAPRTRPGRSRRRLG